MPDQSAIAVEAGRQGLRPRDAGDVAVAERHKMRQHAADAVVLVMHDGGETRIVGPAADGHDRQSGGQPRDHVVAAHHAREDQPVDAARPHRVQNLGLPPRIAVGIGEDRDIIVPRQPVLDAADDRRKGRIGDVGHDHADGARAVGLQMIGRGIRPVSQPLACAADRFGQFRRDRMAALGIERARNRGDMDADLARQVLQGGSRLLPRFTGIPTPSFRNRCGSSGFRRSNRLYPAISAVHCCYFAAFSNG